MVFEANALTAVQEASERFKISLSARLSTASNDPRSDIVVQFLEEEIELQLKTGSDPYIKAAIRARKDGTILVVPKDVAGQPWAEGTTATLNFDDVSIDMPSKQDLGEQTELCLGRMSRGEVALSGADIAKRAFSSALVDGTIAVVIDICIQKYTKPEASIDWNRTTKCFLRTGATSAVASYLAAVNASATVQVAKHAIDASNAFRVARVAGCVAPYVLDTAFDLHKLYQGQISAKGFLRNASGNAGAATAGYLLFPFLARMAVKCGPLGIFVIVVGGAVIAKLGDKAGKGLFDSLSWLPEVLEGIATSRASLQLAVQSRVSSTANSLETKVKREVKRRTQLGKKRLCEEPSCGRKHHARGMCSRHYQRWWRRQRRLGRRLFLELK